MTRPDGTVVAFGSNTGCNSPADPTAIYNSSNGTWAQGPNIPSACGVQGLTACTLADAPAALLPNGNILFAASTGGGWTGLGYPPVTYFFEFTSANGINQVADPPNTANNASFVYNLLVLPNAQVLMTDFSNLAQVYTPVAGFNAAWAPTIGGAPSCVNPDNTYTLSGTQLNGLSQGAAYGDDVQGATNFPLVKILNSSTSHVFYARTTYFVHVDRARSGKFDELPGGGRDRNRSEHALCRYQRHQLGRQGSQRPELRLPAASADRHPRLQRRRHERHCLAQF